MGFMQERDGIRMRRKIIDYFIDEPEEVSLNQELQFYLIMGSPLLILLAVIVLA